MASGASDGSFLSISEFNSELSELLISQKDYERSRQYSLPSVIILVPLTWGISQGPGYKGGQALTSQSPNHLGGSRFLCSLGQGTL